MTIILRLTTRPGHSELRGRPVVLPLERLDVAEQRDGYTWIRTAAGVDLYVVETTDEILDQIVEISTRQQHDRREDTP